MAVHPARPRILRCLFALWSQPKPSANGEEGRERVEKGWRREEKERRMAGVVFNRGNASAGGFVCSSGCESGGAASDVALLERCREKHTATRRRVGTVENEAKGKQSGRWLSAEFSGSTMPGWIYRWYIGCTQAGFHGRETIKRSCSSFFPPRRGK